MVAEVAVKYTVIAAVDAAVVDADAAVDAAAAVCMSQQH